MQLAEQVLALSIEAFGAPLEHYDEALETLWGDEHEAASLRALRGSCLPTGKAGETTRRLSAIASCPASSDRPIAPRAAERAAASLGSVSDNPIYLPPSEAIRSGVASAPGAYHNSMAAPALDDLAGDRADLCLLCHRHVSRLLDGRTSSCRIC